MNEVGNDRMDPRHDSCWTRIGEAEGVYVGATVGPLYKSEETVDKLVYIGRVLVVFWEMD